MVDAFEPAERPRRRDIDGNTANKFGRAAVIAGAGFVS